MASGDGLAVSVPPTRSDVLHACDVAEDVAIAFGFNNIAEALPATATAGAELPLNQLTELLRVDLAAAGFTEVLTWALCSHAENFTQLRREDDGAVRISNPATMEFQVPPSYLLLSQLMPCLRCSLARRPPSPSADVGPAGAAVCQTRGLPLPRSV